MMEDRDEYTSCSICCYEFDEDRIPKYLRCHHYFCMTCVETIAASANHVTCPTCRQKTHISSLMTNNTALSYANCVKKELEKNTKLMEQETVMEVQLFELKTQIETKKKEILATQEQIKYHQTHQVLGRFKRSKQANSAKPVVKRWKLSTNTGGNHRQKKSNLQKVGSSHWSTRNHGDLHKKGASLTAIPDDTDNSSPEKTENMKQPPVSRREVDRLKRTLCSKDLIISQMSEEIMELKQKLKIANEKICRLKQSMSVKKV